MGAFRMVNFALGHARSGYHVFALTPREKIPHRGSRGLYDATLDERRILRMWAGGRGESNIGASPDPSGAFILDIDSKHGADPRDVAGEWEIDETTPVVLTAEAPERCPEFPDSLSGVRGAQFWFHGSRPTGKTAVKGVEVRGQGGYGLLPPSVHPWGDVYDGILPSARELPEPAPGVLQLVASIPAVKTAVEDGTTFDPGGRHEQLLAWARSRYTARGILGEAALMGMLGKNIHSCRPPLPDDEVRRLWKHLEGSRIARSERDRAKPEGFAALWGGHGLGAGR